MLCWHKLSLSHHSSRASRSSHSFPFREGVVFTYLFWKEPRCIFTPPLTNKGLVPYEFLFWFYSCQYLISSLNNIWSVALIIPFSFNLLKADKQMMESDSIWGSKDFQVPEYFNFADVLDEWAGKEKVTRYCSLKRILIFVSAQKTTSIRNVHVLNYLRNAASRYHSQAKKNTYLRR